MKRTVLNMVLRIIVLVFAVIGLGITWDALVGDGELKPFSPIPRQRHIRKTYLAQENPEAQDPLEKMQPAVQILRLGAPEVYQWVEELRRTDRLVFDVALPLDHPQYQETVAFRVPVAGHLILSPLFWQRNNLERAGILVHEYRHARQNFGKIMAERAMQVITLKIFTAPGDTRLEDEAYLYQYAFLRAVGGHSSQVEEHLRNRGYGYLLDSDPFQPGAPPRFSLIR